jgi:hypothetical protein
LTENDTSCCYALQDKVWVHGPGNEPWEVYVVKGDADNLNKEADSVCCCGETATAVEPVSAGATATKGNCC